MQIETRDIAPGVAEVTLQGRLDASGAEQIDLAFNAIAGSHRGLIVDMAKVDYLASIGMRTLLIAAKLMQRRGGTLVLLTPQEEVRRALEIGGLADLLPLVEQREAALRMVGG